MKVKRVLILDQQVTLVIGAEAEAEFKDACSALDSSLMVVSLKASAGKHSKSRRSLTMRFVSASRSHLTDRFRPLSSINDFHGSSQKLSLKKPCSLG